MPYTGGFPSAGQLVKIARGRYDFDVDGGDVGDYALGGPTIPANSIIKDVYVACTTANTSAGAATVSLGFVGDEDALLALTAFDNDRWTAGEVRRVATFPAGAAEVIVTDADVVLGAAVAVAALTAGAWDVIVEYVELPDADL